MEKFLSPTSMVTPGAAGSIVLFISNALYLLLKKWISTDFLIVLLALSFLVGLVALIQPPTPRWTRALYYVLNSLVIFGFALGAHSVGKTIVDEPASPRISAAAPAGGVTVFTEAVRPGS
jgi:hypothetical protein